MDKRPALPSERDRYFDEHIPYIHLTLPTFVRVYDLTSGENVRYEPLGVYATITAQVRAYNARLAAL